MTLQLVYLRHDQIDRQHDWHVRIHTVVCTLPRLVCWLPGEDTVRDTARKRVKIQRGRDRERKRETEKERERQRKKERDREREKEKEKEREREIEKKIEREK